MPLEKQTKQQNANKNKRNKTTKNIYGDTKNLGTVWDWKCFPTDEQKNKYGILPN